MAQLYIVEDGNHPGYFLRGNRRQILALIWDGCAPHVVSPQRLNAEGEVLVREERPLRRDRPYGSTTPVWVWKRPIAGQQADYLDRVVWEHHLRSASLRLEKATTRTEIAAAEAEALQILSILAADPDQIELPQYVGVE